MNLQVQGLEVQGVVRACHGNCALLNQTKMRYCNLNVLPARCPVTSRVHDLMRAYRVASPIKRVVLRPTADQWVKI